MSAAVQVCIAIVTDQPEHVARAVEQFTRMATGLALEGVPVSVWIGPDEWDDDDDDE